MTSYDDVIKLLPVLNRPILNTNPNPNPNPNPYPNQQLPVFILGPLHMSVTNGARKLKFGTLVAIDA